MKYFSAISTIILLLFFIEGDAKAGDCKCQCLDHDGSVFAKPPRANTPELCSEICSRVIIGGRGLTGSCPVEGKPPVNGGAKQDGTDRPPPTR
jgi:hypothetical protein